MNPSPTGHYQGKHNRASPEQTLRYLGRLSGPFLDRFDLSLEIPLPPPGMLSQGTQGESSARPAAGSGGTRTAMLGKKTQCASGNVK
jgi:predicted ATPase with chaperone activity